MDYTQQEHPPEPGASRDRAAPHRTRDDLKAYQDGELPLLRRWWVGRHVAKCAMCQAEITVLQRLTRDMQELERAVPRPQLRARILASLPDAPPAVQGVSHHSANARPAFGMMRRPMLAASGACAALLLMVGALALNHWQHTVQQTGNPSIQAVLAPSADESFVSDNRLTKSQTNNDGVAESVSASGEPAPAPLDPFSPAHSANASAEISSAASQVVSGTTSTHLSSPPASATPGNVANARRTSGETYTDPTSRAAEELASRVLPDKLEVERRNMASPVLQPARFVQQTPTIKNSGAGAMQMVFAVTDVSEARRQVQRWAEQTGAKVTALANSAGGTGSGTMSADNAFTPAGAAATSPSRISAQTPTLLQIQIPARQAEMFKSLLSDMGTPMLPSKKPLWRLPHAVMAEDRREGSRMENSVHPLPTPVPVEGTETETDGIAKRAGSFGYREAKATVTILLRLQPGSLPR